MSEKIVYTCQFEPSSFVWPVTITDPQIYYDILHHCYSINYYDSTTNVHKELEADPEFTFLSSQIRGVRDEGHFTFIILPTPLQLNDNVIDGILCKFTSVHVCVDLNTVP